MIKRATMNRLSNLAARSGRIYKSGKSGLALALLLIAGWVMPTSAQVDYDGATFPNIVITEQTATTFAGTFDVEIGGTKIADGNISVTDISGQFDGGQFNLFEGGGFLTLSLRESVTGTNVSRADVAITLTPVVGGNLTGMSMTSRTGQAIAPNIIRNIVYTGTSATAVDNQSVLNLISGINATPSDFASGSDLDFFEGNFDVAEGFSSGAHDRNWSVDVLNGTAMSFRYVTAGIDEIGTERLGFSVSGFAPVFAVDDEVAVLPDSSNTIVEVLANDTFGSNGPSSTAITISSPASNGSAAVRLRGTPTDPTDDAIAYTPAPGFTGIDTFVYEICDATLACDTATVTVRVNDTSSCHVDAVNPISPEAHYTFEGNTNDISGNGHNPINTPGVTFINDAVQGGSSVQNTGNGVALSTTSGVFPNDAYDARTISMFIKASDITTDQVLYDGGSDSDGMLLWLSNGRLRARYEVGNVGTNAGVAYPADGEWHHVGVVYDGVDTNSWNLYLDGYPVAGAEGVGSIPAMGNLNGLLRGFNATVNGGGAGNPFLGLMDDVAIYTSALTPAQMVAIASCAGDNLLAEFADMQCPIEGFQVASDPTDGTWVTFDLVTGEFITNMDDLQNQVNGGGYNRADGRFWMYHVASAADNLVVAVRNPDGTFSARTINVVSSSTFGELPSTDNYNSGDVDENGVLYLYGTNQTAIQRVDLNPTSDTYLQYLGPLTLSAPVRSSDIVFHFVDGFLYTIANDGTTLEASNLFRITPNTGRVVDLGPSGITPGSCGGAYGGQYIDADGFMYAVCNDTGVVSRIDLTTLPVISNFDSANTIENFSSTIITAGNDGLRCAAASVPIDYGDAPNSYDTLLAANGPRHSIGNINSITGLPQLLLGSGVDNEADGQPSGNADGDDANGSDDEDGITWPILVPAISSTVPVAIVNSTGADAYLNAWVDFNEDGDFADANEQVASDQIVANMVTSVDLMFTTPSSTALGDTFARVRVCSMAAQCNTPVGVAGLGEVEDYAVRIGELNYDDLPDSYGTLDASRGPAHSILSFDSVANTSSLMLGSSIGVALDGSPGAAADGDSFDDGVSISLSENNNVVVTATASGTNSSGSTAMLCGYLDGAGRTVADINGSFERNVSYPVNQVGIGSSASAAAGNEELCIQVTNGNTVDVVGPTALERASASCTVAGNSFSCTLIWVTNFTTAGTTYARFRLTTDSDFFSNTSPSPTGDAVGGEVEGMVINFSPTPTLVTIGSVNLETVDLQTYAEMLDLPNQSAAQLHALVSVWSADLAASLQGADVATLLAAIYAYLDADGDGQLALLRWDTLEQYGTVGFFVGRADASGDWQLISDNMLPARLAAPMGAEYVMVDRTAVSGNTYRYVLIEQEAGGRQRTYGPFELSMQ